MNSEQLVKVVLDVLKEHKALDIVKINIGEKSSIADYFVVCSGRATTQVKALAEYVEEAVEKNGGDIKRKEGVREGRWAALDCGDVIVHIFNDETRLFYHLERLWGDENNIEKIASKD